MTVQITLGADPEFGYLNNLTGQQVMADDINIRYTGRGGNVGLDGHPDIGEIRPAPGVRPAEVVNNVRILIGALSSKLAEKAAYSHRMRVLKVKAGNMVGPDPVGGHIHLGFPKRFHRDTVYNDLVNVLTYHFAPLAVLLEGREEARQRRMNSTYGGLFNWRQQPHGLEYRAPGSWIVEPGIAKAYLSLAYMVAHEFFNGHIPPRPYTPPKGALTKDYSEYNTAHLKAHFWAVAKTWPHYQLYRDREIAGALGFLKQCVIMGRTWRENRDLRVTWGFATEEELAQLQGASVPTDNLYDTLRRPPVGDVWNFVWFDKDENYMRNFAQWETGEYPAALAVSLPKPILLVFRNFSDLLTWDALGGWKPSAYCATNMVELWDANIDGVCRMLPNTVSVTRDLYENANIITINTHVMGSYRPNPAEILRWIMARLGRVTNLRWMADLEEMYEYARIDNADTRMIHNRHYDEEARSTLNTLPDRFQAIIEWPDVGPDEEIAF